MYPRAGVDRGRAGVYMNSRVDENPTVGVGVVPSARSKLGQSNATPIPPLESRGERGAAAAS